MRLSPIVVLIMMFASLSSAQTQLNSGVYSFGGSISYASSSYDDHGYSFSESDVSVSPTASVFVADQIELSGAVSYGYQRAQVVVNGSNTHMKYSNMELSIGGRYFFQVNSVAPFLGVRGGVLWKTQNSIDNTPFGTPIFEYSFTGGVAIFVAPTVAIEPLIRYTSTRIDSDVTNDVTFFGVEVEYFIR